MHARIPRELDCYSTQRWSGMALSLTEALIMPLQRPSANGKLSSLDKRCHSSIPGLIIELGVRKKNRHLPMVYPHVDKQALRHDPIISDF